MIKKFAEIILKILSLLDLIIYYLFKKNFLIFFKDEIEKKLIFKDNILKKEVKFFCPNYTCFWRYKSWLTREIETIKWIDSFSSNANLFWDVGANIGIFSLYSAIKHSNIKVISFEPSTSNLRILSRNIFLNKFSERVSIIPLALSDKNKFSLFNESNFIEGSALHSFQDQNDAENIHKYSTLGTSVDFMIENDILKCPDYLKIDVDGLEEKIIFNSTSILKNKKLKSILIEITDEVEDKFQLSNFIENFGFKKIRLDFSTSKSRFNNYKNYIFQRII